ncbi:hypothetical protein GOBAR_AA33177 [Gossypium barbadense]|uniref:Proteasome alpha-type subunits domain-containing protein n=1 Tax=Gossypium barbadense TaxID=3634 RepID=A0A2P5W8S3_GOSBA|nr:hypothetical protein GOBAR_AA33177 [Gossypium barbadense]
MEAINLGSTAIGIKTKDGVVLAVEKCSPSPLNPALLSKIMEIDEYIGCAMSRLITDALVETQSRPFGVSPLIAGHDENGPSLDN